MNPADIARALDEIAVLLQLAGESRLPREGVLQRRAGSERRGRSTRGSWRAHNRLATVRGLSGAIGDKVREALATGRVVYLDELRAATPPGLLALIRVPGLGPKKAKAIFDALAVNSLAELEAACLGRAACPGEGVRRQIGSEGARGGAVPPPRGRPIALRPGAAHWRGATRPDRGDGRGTEGRTDRRVAPPLRGGRANPHSRRLRRPGGGTRRGDQTRRRGLGWRAFREPG